MLNPDGPNDTLAARLVVGFALLVVVFILLCAGCSTNPIPPPPPPPPSSYRFDLVGQDGFGGPYLYRITNTETGESRMFIRAASHIVVIPGDF